MTVIKVLREISLTILSQTAMATWTNQPAAETELLGQTRHRTKMDLTNYRQARIVVGVITAGAATPAKIRAQYSTDESTWAYLDEAYGPSLNIDTTGVKASSWVNLTANTKADVFLRIVGIDGSGAVSPQFGLIILQFK